MTAMLGSPARSVIPCPPSPAMLPWLRGLSSMLLVAWAFGASATEPPVTAVSLLTRIQQAAEHQSYAGTYVHQQGSQVQSSRVAHAEDRTGEHEKLELMDGQPREFVRLNDEVRSYVPDSKLLLIEKRARNDTFPALLTTTAADIDQYYRLSFGGTERIAGRTAQLVVLDPRDDRRYGYRLWFDHDTYLLLKAQTLNDKGGVLEQMMFTDVTIGGAIDPARLKPTATSTDGWRVETNHMVPVDLGRAGWTVTQPVAGFRKVMEVRRAFGGREDIGQMVYSDGLASISIFIESTAPQDAVEGDASKGPVNVLTKRHGDFWLTIVGDAPGVSVREMGSSIEFRPK